jgi:hypothetical protein
VTSIRKSQPEIPPRKVRVRIAAQADLDERTVTRYLKGESNTLPIMRRAIHDAARVLGVDLGVSL